MGNYNPHAPQILGQEWVPIRDAAYLPDSITERGYQWFNGDSVVPISGCFYIAQVPETMVLTSADLISVYPAGTEDQTGPIKVLNIPVSAVLATGAGAANINVTKGFTALNNPADNSSIGLGIMSVGSPGDLVINFDATSYSQQLLGKRILDVSFRYALQVQPEDASGLDLFLGFAKNIDVGSGSGTGGPLEYGLGMEGTPAGQPLVIRSISFNDINRIWDANTKPLAQRDARPWRYQELARFAATEPFASRYMVMIFDTINNTANYGANLFFADLQITYCEEKRVKYGASVLHDAQGTAAENPSFYNVGPQLVQLVGPDFLNTGALGPGSYVTTHTHRDIAFLGISTGFTGQPVLNALRELYQLPPQLGKVINQSLVPDATFTVTGSSVLPEITLHHSGGVVTGSHAYGFQDEIPVYGSTVAIQEIEDDPVGASAQFPQVRFYARRFGDTTTSLRLIDVASGTFTVSITPAEFDALPTIVDGWKEVTLRFASPPSFSTTGGNIDWRWDCVGETAGNQWQVLGAGSVNPASSIAPANYFAPLGNTTTLSWQSPAISGAGAADQMSDAVLIFSQDPPTITGFAITTSTQTVTGVNLNCGVPKSCIPTGIYCNNITWSNNSAIFDTFTREVASGWGNADTGQAWTNAGGTAPNYSVTSGRGVITIPTGDLNSRNETVAGAFTGVDVSCTIRVGAIAAGSTINAYVFVRFIDTSNHYRLRLAFTTSGTIDLFLQKVSGGSTTTLATISALIPYTAGGDFRARVRMIGSLLQGKIWAVGTGEPDWEISATDATHTSGQTGIRADLGTGNTNTNPQIFFDDYSAVASNLAESGFELQRSDTVDTTWQTIMSTSTVQSSSFCDYEARVGVVSSYRLRVCNVLDFCGTWVTGSATLPTPGVTSPNTSTGTGVLIFTSNKNPSSNLAYRMQFEDKPIEQFVFPEADLMQLQAMFGKDFATAFHPLERGGERFGRTLLVSAAAIPVKSLANFNSLRDLAWASLPYVCVRDELGNRWFASIRIPSGNVRRNRKLYFAQIEVAETTNIPAPAGT